MKTLRRAHMRDRHRHATAVPAWPAGPHTTGLASTPPPAGKNSPDTPGKRRRNGRAVTPHPLHGPDLEAVPDHPGPRRPGGRLRPPGHRAPAAHLRPDVIEHGTRRAHLAGIAAHHDGAWTIQAACNFLLDPGHRATSIKFLVRDRAGQSTGSFDAVFKAEGIKILASLRRHRANATCETIISTLRRELSGRLLIINKHHLRRVLTAYLLHYNTARPHHALRRLTPAQAHTRPPQINLADYRVHRKQVLGGRTSEYHIAG